MTSDIHKSLYNFSKDLVGKKLLDQYIALNKIKTLKSSTPVSIRLLSGKKGFKKCISGDGSEQECYPLPIIYHNLNKLENTYSNYSFRNGLYYITAPKSGYITKTITSGIGEIIKAGKEILTLMPSEYDLAVEMYINPIDLPLVHKGEKVRIQFDGWPSIVFSGWPNTSFGTFGGEIYAIDQYIGVNGKYRVLIKSDENDKKWPEALRFGTGTSNLIMLNDVPIWYELWRNINGFPSEFYTVKNKEIKKEK